MITGFEDKTFELTDKELAYLPFIVAGLQLRVGKDRAVKNQEMCDGIKKTHGYKFTPSRIRKIIHHIRVEGLVPRLVATSKGYYVCNSKEELEDYVKSLNQRIRSIEEIRDAMSKQLNS